MPVRIVWSKLARQDLIDQYLVLGSANPDAAERFYDRIESRVLQLVDHPRMGPRRSDIRPTTRVLIEMPFLVLYETSPDSDDDPVVEVEIVRIVHGRRDIGRLF